MIRTTRRAAVVLGLFLTAGGGRAASAETITATKSAPPAGLRFPGRVVQTLAWVDALGENRLVLSETGPRPSAKAEDSSDAELFAQHLRRPAAGQPFAVLWTLRDFVRDCSFDLQVSFVGAARVTDLDRDGTAETTLLYVLGCFSDVSGKPTKLVVHEGKAKYAIRGECGHPDGERIVPGTMSVDPSFKRAPAPLREHALRLWKEQVLGRYL
jgi:hypothetical protein